MANDDYRNIPGGTHDERLLETPRPDEFLHTDTWRVFRIMGEFVQGFEDLAPNHERRFDFRFGAHVARRSRLHCGRRKPLRFSCVRALR